MISAVTSLQTLILVVLFSAARITAAFIITPFFSQEVIPGLARNVIIFNLTIIVIPLTLTTVPSGNLTAAMFVLLIVKEVIIGFFLGFLVSIAFHVAQSVGAFLDTQRGSSMGQMFDPMFGESSTSMGALFSQIITLIFFVGGGFMVFMGFMYESYIFWPLFSFFPTFDNPQIPVFFLSVMDGLMQDIVLISAPVAIVMFLAEFGLGMMNRFAPQLNVFSLSMPIKSGVGLFMLILYASTMFILFKLQLLEGEKLLKTIKLIIK